MKITFLGSAAAPGVPVPYCDCPTCSHARKHKGRNLRKRCSYAINCDLLVDMGPDLFAACAIHDVDLLNTKYALITHSHMDHFFYQNLKLRAKGFRDAQLPELTFVAGPSVMTLLNQGDLTDEQMGLTRKPILPFDKVVLPDYTVQSLKATHFPEIGDAMNYMIDDREKKLLIAHDTGIYEDRVWPYLENIELDGLVIEATLATSEARTNHLNLEHMKKMIAKMRSINAVSDHTVIYANHFGHRQVPPHEELSDLLGDIGVRCGYDGLVAEI